MLVNLSDVLTSEGRQLNMEVPLEMTSFKSKMGSFEIMEKSPVTFTFINIKPDKAKVNGNVKLIFKEENVGRIKPH